MEDYRTPLMHRLDAFIAKIEDEVRNRELDPERLGLLSTYLGEARVGLELIEPYLEPNLRILEVGSGIGALGAFLAQEGYRIQGIEPAGTGFSLMSELAREVSAIVGDVGFNAQARAAESLRPELDGYFDLIYSVHVLEHVEDPETVIRAMTAMLGPDGAMLHLCPNYRFPYDPHLGIPLVFWSETLTGRLFSKRIAEHQEVWDSLNFLTAGKLQDIAEALNLRVTFQSDVMGNTLSRMLDDPIFRARHSNWAGRLASWFMKSPASQAIKIAPPKWSSPMAVHMTPQTD